MGISDFKFVSYITWYDGPLCSVVDTKTSETPAILSWYDTYKDQMCFFLLQPEIDVLMSYLQNEISFLDLFKNAQKIQSIVVTTNSETITDVSFDEIPDDVLPTPNSYIGQDTSEYVVSEVLAHFKNLVL